MAETRSSVLLPWQVRLLRVLMGLFVVLFLNSIYLWCYSTSSDPPLAYYVNLLFHFGLGLIIVVPAAVYVFTHQRRARAIPNRPAIMFGMLAASAVGICTAVGIFLFVLAASGGAVTRQREWWSLWLHRSTACAIPLLYLLHMRARRTISWSLPRRTAWAASALAAVMMVLFVFGREARPADLVNSGQPLQPVDPYVNKSSPFFPSSAESSTGGPLPVDLLLTSQKCASCHQDIFKQWNESAHHFSSFNNPWYRKSVDYMRDVTGPVATRWCAGCHDAALLFPGLMLMKEKMHLPESHAGVACMVCHGITHVKDTTGNASYVLSPPPSYPWENSGNPIEAGVSDFLIRVKPAPHRAAMLKPFHKTSEFCSTCHKVSLQEPVNDFRWARGLNDYDAWQGSGVSGYGARPFYRPPQTKTCGDCHMPKVASSDFGNVNGFVHDHRFAAANTALPALNRHPDQLEKVTKFLQSGAVTVDLFAVTKQGVVPMEDAKVEPGDDMRADIVVRTRAVGHAFPTGTVDAFEIWTELKVTDAGGKVIFWNGFKDDKGEVDKGAHFFRGVLVDGHSKRINKRNAWMGRSPVYNENVPPGAAKVVRYAVRVPKDAKLPLTFEARLHDRKFDAYYHHFTFNGEVEQAGEYRRSFDERKWKTDGPTPIDLPDVVMSERIVAVGGPTPTKAPAWPLWERYNDYGIGMFLSQDLKAAAAAWEHVVSLAPKYADGPINVARAQLEEGKVDSAVTWLQKGLALDPNSGAGHFFLGAAYKQQGRLQDAARELETALARYPRDRVARNQLGRIYFLQERYDRALEQYRATLDIDPEDMMAHQGLMLSYRALGNEKMAHEHEQRYMRYKPEETQTQLNGPFFRANPDLNREAQPIHEHVDGRQTPAAQ